MSNLHLNLDEANKHTPKGFDNAAANTRPWKDESNQSTYTENETLPRALNFVDGTTAPPTTTNGHIYVITGTGTVNAGWGSASFNDWVRFANGFPVSISPVTGYLCYDITASQWMEFDGATWATFGGGGVVNTIFTGGTMSADSTVIFSGFSLSFGTGLKLLADGSVLNYGGASSTSMFMGNLSGLAITTGGSNTFYGGRTGMATTTGSNNTFVGDNAGMSNIGGLANTFVGDAAGEDNDSGNYNTFLGQQSGKNNTTGDHNTFLGHNTGVGNTTSDGSTFLGSYAGYASSGRDNTFVGYLSSRFNSSGIENVSIGRDASVKNTTGNGNVTIGTKAGNRNVTGSGNVKIGHEAGYRDLGSDKLFIDNQLRGSDEATARDASMIYGEFHATPSSQKLQINASVGIGILGGAAKLHVKGSGSTSATSALLFQNSLGTDLLEVKDDGTILMTASNIIEMGANDLTFNGGASSRPLFRHQSGFGGIEISGPSSGSGGSVIFSQNYATSLTAAYSVTLDGVGDLTFISGDPSDFATKENVRITKTGSVGIGTSAPSEKLHVNGSTRFDGSISVNGNAGFTGTGAYTNFTIENGIITAAS